MYLKTIFNKNEDSFTRRFCFCFEHLEFYLIIGYFFTGTSHIYDGDKLMFLGLEVDAKTGFSILKIRLRVAQSLQCPTE